MFGCEFLIRSNVQVSDTWSQSSLDLIAVLGTYSKTSITLLSQRCCLSLVSTPPWGESNSPALRLARLSYKGRGSSRANQIVTKSCSRTLAGGAGAVSKRLTRSLTSYRRTTDRVWTFGVVLLHHDRVLMLEIAVSVCGLGSLSAVCDMAGGIGTSRLNTRGADYRPSHHSNPNVSRSVARTAVLL